MFTDLVPPGEVYIPDESDVIPVRTWSRGDPYAQDADGGFSRLPEKEPVAISVSMDGMLHYSALQTVHDGSEPPMEEDGGEFDDGDNYNDYDDNDDDEEEEEILPNNGGVKYNDVEEEYDSYQQSQAQAADEDFYETDILTKKNIMRKMKTSKGMMVMTMKIMRTILRMRMRKVKEAGRMTIK